MYETITRKVGNSIAITLPKELRVDLNQKFIIAKTQNGGFVLVPKIDNPLQSLEDDFVMTDEFSSSSLEGNEVI